MLFLACRYSGFAIAEILFDLQYSIERGIVAFVPLPPMEKYALACGVPLYTFAFWRPDIGQYVLRGVTDTALSGQSVTHAKFASRGKKNQLPSLT